MNKLLAVIAVGVLACAGPALAADTKAAATTAPAAGNSQQDKMKTCNDQAGDKKGDERKAFMKTCLSAKPAAPMTQSEKMSMCNKKTAGMNKEDRAKAQSECMKGS